MNLKPKAAAAWLAAPLVAMALIACGDDGGTTSTDTDTGDGGTTTAGVCGDSKKQGDEECDDGNTEPGDGCAADCTKEPEASCGDGKKNGTEECDSGNANGAPGNACTAQCLNDTHGDGHRGPDEDCDDGNRVDDDNCDNTGHVPAPPAKCGDGNQDDGEECDNGKTNGVPGDSCTVACKTDTCGNGQRGPGEDCDDGNTVGSDNCGNDCKEPPTLPTCGDGNVDDGEACDLGDDNGSRDSSCTDKCKDATCGDGIINNNEACDEGAENGRDGSKCAIDCNLDQCGNGQVGPNEACDDGDANSDTGACSTTCTTTDCGDGTKQDSEECDNGKDNGVAGGDCTAACKSNTCGDGYVGGDEECDLGKGNGGNGSPGVNCTTSCKNNVCGDGFVAGAEACDEGDANSDTGNCTKDCKPPGCGDGIVQDGETCDNGAANSDTVGDCTKSCKAPACGDGHIQEGEECDDGNGNSDTAVGACRTSCKKAGCGDSIIDTGEECDLGAQNGVGGVCSSNCHNTSCGDAIVQDDEQCDDGNTNNNDSCLTTCKWNVCGDGAVYTYKSDPLNTGAIEECDDANTADSDSCLKTCKYNVCADSAQLTTLTEPYGDPDQNGPMTASRVGILAFAPSALGYYCLEDDGDCSNADFHYNANGIRTGSGKGQVDLEDGTECEPGVFFLGLPVATDDVCAPEPLDNFVLGAVNVEQCDDGNSVNTDACVAANFDTDGALECHKAMCGDGLILAGTEQCDEAIGSDARDNNNDSCIDTCKYNVCQDGWKYVSKTDTSNAAALEACDDGNAENDDLCSSTCTVSGLLSSSATGISATCGDSVIQPGEGCDKGTGNNSDVVGSTCSSKCQIPTCGNGIKEGEEQCDDGNADNNDQCVNTCLWNVCGDGFRYIATASGKATNNQPLEECDDANGNNRDMCTTSCTWNKCGDNGVYSTDDAAGTDPETDAEWAALTGLGGPSYAYHNGTAATVNECDDSDDIAPPPEGDRYDNCWDPSYWEECDDGNAVNGDGCNSCEISTCGDGVKDEDEACDDGNVLSGDGCEADCSLPPSCGDGIRQYDEACDGDDFDLGGGLGSAPGADVTCLADCRLSTCRGTAGVQSGEECDDGNTVDSDKCTSRCLVTKCGDGIVQPLGLNGADETSGSSDDEECDDGNDDETDSCTNECKFNVLGDGIRYTHKSIDSYDLAFHACDTGTVTDTQTNRASYRVERDADACDPVVGTSTCDGDGYKDETDFCGAADDPVVANRGKILCKANQSARGLTAWKNNTYCLMPAEAHGSHGDNAPSDLLGNDWYDAKSHCESYGIGAHLVVVTTAAERTTLASTANAAGVAGVSDAQVGYCAGEGEDIGDFCNSDEDCDDVCVATQSWIGLYDDFTGEVNGGVPVSTDPGRWYWLGASTPEDLANNTTHALWKYSHPSGQPIDFSQYPSDGGDCGELDQGTDGTVSDMTEGWADQNCGVEYAYMCEFPL
jgi:cysteine-rich repeat protein